MATLESAFTVFAAHTHFISKSNKYPFFSAKPSHTNTIFLNFPLSTSLPLPSLSLTLSSNTTQRFESLCSALQDVPIETKQTTNSIKKKLYLVNLPWSLSAVDIKNLFAQCGTVTDVEMIKNKDGRMTGFAFVTMASGEEAQAAIDKFNSQEISGRTIRVELAKRFKKPRPPGPPAGETRHKLYVSNLAWEVRSSHLRVFFTENFKTPVSARVVFDSPTGRCAGYGFVSFVTKEEAEEAISALDGKEFMRRPLRLKLSHKTVEQAGNDKEEEQGFEPEDQLEEEI